MAPKRLYKKALGKSKKRAMKRVKTVGAYTASRRSVRKYKGNVILGLGFPRKMTMTHKYEEAFSLTSTTGALATYRFNANGMYDPNTSGTGHQPLFFDQMSALYNHYTVIGSKITITVMNSTSAGVAGVVGVIYNDDTATSYTDITNFGEQSNGRTRMIPGGANTTFTLGMKYSARKTFGGSVLANTALQGSSTTNPGEASYFDIGYQANGTGTNAIYLKVHVTYIAVWSEIKDVGPS